MALDETRHRETPVELDNLGFRTDVRGDFIVAANRSDLVAIDRDSLDVAEGGIDRCYLASPQHEICRLDSRGIDGRLR